MYRLPGARVVITIGEGAFAGAAVEVEPIGTFAIRYVASGLVNAFYAAKDPGAEFVALTKAYELFVDEAQPTWAIADHRGPIPPTADGMLRLPVPLALDIIGQWIEPPPSAVDELIPPGPLRDALNEGLKANRKD